MDKFQKLLLEDLRSLGNGPTQVAATLWSRRIRGDRNKPNSCPIAKWLKKEYGAEAQVGAVMEYPDFESVDEVKVNGVVVRMPRAIIQFIIKFDKGDYPELEW